MMKLLLELQNQRPEIDLGRRIHDLCVASGLKSLSEDNEMARSQYQILDRLIARDDERAEELAQRLKKRAMEENIRVEKLFAAVTTRYRGMPGFDYLLAIPNFP